MRRVFAMEDEERIGRYVGVEQHLSQLILLAEVGCAMDMAASELVLESTVDDDLLIVHMIEVAIENADQRAIGDTGEAIRLTRRCEAGELERGSVVNVHHRLQTARGVAVGLLPLVHDVAGVLVHTQ